MIGPRSKKLRRHRCPLHPCMLSEHHTSSLHVDSQTHQCSSPKLRRCCDSLRARSLASAETIVKHEASHSISHRNASPRRSHGREEPKYQPLHSAIFGLLTCCPQTDGRPLSPSKHPRAEPDSSPIRQKSLQAHTTTTTKPLPLPKVRLTLPLSILGFSRR